MAYCRLGHIKEASGGNMAEGLKNCIGYIFNPEKTEENRLIGGYNIKPDVANPTGSVYENMILVKDAYGKRRGRQGYHYKLSFPADDTVTPELAMKITEEFCAMCFSDYQCAFAVHTNTEHLHSHIVFNSVAITDGLKYHYKKGDWAAIIQPAANKICEKYGLKSLDLNLDEDLRLTHKCKKYGSWLKDNNIPKKKTSAYTNSMIRADIDLCIKNASDFDEFISLMEKLGHKVSTSGKHLSVLAPGRSRPCRTYILSPDKQTYTKDNIKKMIDGFAMSYSEVYHRLFSDWNAYKRQTAVKIKKIRVSPELAKSIEDKDFRIKNRLYTYDDVKFYGYYLDACDKHLNILKKHISDGMAAKAECIEALRNLLGAHGGYMMYLKTGDGAYKESYDRAYSLYNTITAHGYGIVELYNYVREGNSLLAEINEYKKHIYVEEKICSRIRDKMEKSSEDFHKKPQKPKNL